MTVIVLVPNLGFFVLLQYFELDELDGSDFKYDKIIFKFLTQKYAIKTFLEPNLRTFIFAPNFETGQIDFKYGTSIFKFQPKNTQISYFWSQSLGF